MKNSIRSFILRLKVGYVIPPQRGSGIVKNYISKLLLIFILALGLFGSVAYSGNLDFEVIDNLGREVSLSSPPRKIVVTSPRVTEIAFALGLGDRIVGVTSVTDSLNYVPDIKRKAEEKTKVGDAYSGLSTEKIVELRPNLVLLDTSVFPEDAAGRLLDLGIKVYGAGGKSPNEIMETVLEIGKLTGKLEKAKKIVGKMTLEGIVLDRRRGNIKNTFDTFYMLDDSIYTVGRSAYLNRIMNMAGLENVFGKKKKSWIKVSNEAVLKADPELILVADNPKVKNMEDLKSLRGLAETSAVRHENVVFLSGKLTSKLNQAGTKLLEGVLDLIDLLEGKVR